MKPLLFILLLFSLAAYSQEKNKKERYSLPVYIFMTKEQRQDSLINALSDSIERKGFTVIKEEERERLLKIHYERMFKLVAEDREKGVDPDPERLNRRLPRSHQIISFELQSIQTAPAWTIHELTLRVYSYPTVKKAFVYKFPDAEVTNISLHQLVEKILERCDHELERK